MRTIAYKASRMCFLHGERDVCEGEGSCSGGEALFDPSPVRVVLSASVGLGGVTWVSVSIRVTEEEVEAGAIFGCATGYD